MLESLRCNFTYIAIKFKHDLTLSKCQSLCSAGAISVGAVDETSFSPICRNEDCGLPRFPQEVRCRLLEVQQQV